MGLYSEILVRKTLFLLLNFFQVGDFWTVPGGTRQNQVKSDKPVLGRVRLGVSGRKSGGNRRDWLTRRSGRLNRVLLTRTIFQNS